MPAVPVLTDRESLETLYAVNPVEIDGLPWTDVSGSPGVHEKVLWRLGAYVQALIRYEPGAETVGEPHLAAHHHIWVVNGAGTIAGRRLVQGSYMHVPPGVRHPVGDVGPEGLTLLQMHRPHAPVEAGRLADAD
jgi:hypothetical protein